MLYSKICHDFFALADPEVLPPLQRNWDEHSFTGTGDLVTGGLEEDTQVQGE